MNPVRSVLGRLRGRPAGRPAMAALNVQVIERFRAGQTVPGMHRERLLLLTTTGARSGAPRTAPLMFVATADGVPTIIASNDGAATHPAWFVNLVADPAVVVETSDGERWPAVAEVLAGDARRRRWAELLATMPSLADHQRRAGAREIPLVVLRRR